MAEYEDTVYPNYNRYTNSGPQPGYNGLSGFKTWECYMLIKYGKPGSFGVGGDYEYLIELPIYPEQVTESIAAGWSKQQILGRSSPLSAYANTDLKSVSFSMDLHRDLLTGSFSHNMSTLAAVPNASVAKQAAGLQVQSGPGPYATRSWYVNINKMLQAACYPQYTNNGQIPPTTYFIFGQMILKGYVSSYSTHWKKPIINTFYGNNTVDITMACYPDTVISARDIIGGSGSMSTQNTFNTEFPTKVGSSNVMTNGITRNRGNERSDSQLGTGIMDT